MMIVGLFFFFLCVCVNSQIESFQWLLPISGGLVFSTTKQARPKKHGLNTENEGI